MDIIKLLKKDDFLLPDFFGFFCGEKLGSGESRIVYDFKPDPSLVVKIDLTRYFFNITEWENWTQIKHCYPKIAEKYLAECIRISDCGKVMLQKKTTPLPSDYKLPNKMPHFLWDLKRPNWGLIDGKLKCHDYANTRIFRSLNTSMDKAEWY